MIVDRASFTVALAAIARIVGSRSIIPELRISAENDALSLAGTDGEHWLYLQVPCEGGLEATLVHAQRLHDVVASLVPDHLTIDLGEGFLRIDAGRAKRKLATLSPDTWPERDFTPTATLSVDSDRLRDAFGFTLPCVANADLSKAFMNGVHLTRHAGKLRAIGCDAFNTAIADIEPCSADIATTVSPKTVETVTRLACHSVEIAFNDRSVEFRWPNGRIIGPLVAGEYPAIQIGKMLEREYPEAASVEAKALLNAVRSVRPVGTFDSMSRSSRVTMTLNGTGQLSTQSGEGSADEEFEADWSGEEISVGFASARMEKALAGFGDAVLRLGIRNPQDPMKFEAEAQPDRIAMLYPMKI